MKGYVDNIERLTLQNETFRTVLYTTPRSQLVIMTLQPGEDIGLETHEEHDQFIRVEAGTGEAVLNGVSHPVADGFAIVIPAGTEHNVKNTGSDVLRLYTLYTPPEHRHGVVHETKEGVEEEHFDGVTSK
ncbi:cupin domain-containing protein [Candidatus Kaiserbacteria bacterium]|nr:cupin domain-containing protein [Candidatus Kaiserbacteria bacterium]